MLFVFHSVWKLNCGSKMIWATSLIKYLIHFLWRFQSHFVLISTLKPHETASFLLSCVLRLNSCDLWPFHNQNVFLFWCFNKAMLHQSLSFHPIFPVFVFSFYSVGVQTRISGCLSSFSFCMCSPCFNTPAGIVHVSLAFHFCLGPQWNIAICWCVGKGLHLSVTNSKGARCFFA